MPLALLVSLMLRLPHVVLLRDAEMSGMSRLVCLMLPLPHLVLLRGMGMSGRSRLVCLQRSLGVVTEARMLRLFLLLHLEVEVLEEKLPQALVHHRVAGAKALDVMIRTGCGASRLHRRRCKHRLCWRYVPAER